MSEALEVALKLLARRARSEAEVRRALGRKGLEERDVEAAIARLKELRYLDDPSFARSKAGSMLEEERKGPKLAVYKLEAAGIEERQAETAVEQAKEGKSERELAERALRGRRPALAEDAPRAERIKAARWLVGRGFSEEIARELLRLGEDSSPE